jgi:Protein of unknown function (DUF3014)
MAGTVPAPDFRADPGDRTDLRPRRRSGLATAAVLAAVAAAAAWFWWPEQEPSGRRTPSSAPAAAEDGAPPAAAPAAPDVQYPLPTTSEPLALEGVAAALQQLLGPGAMEAFVFSDDFPRRLVATLDQLGREHAPASLWPVAPAPGRFLVEQRGDATVIAADNAQRYAPMVRALASVDAAATVALYRRMVPLLDRAWRTLGMGERHLNDRVFEVIDLLLATPEPAQPIAVLLTEVKGPVPSLRPWVRYEFADPKLQALPAGQKVLLRMGQAERQQVKDKLRDLRRHLVQGR